MRGRGLLIALTVSVALNLFLLSAGAVIVFLGRHPAVVQAIGMRRAAGSLNPADQHAFLAMLRAQGASDRAETRGARALRDHAWSTLADGSVSVAAVKEDLAQARAINIRTRGKVEEATVDFAASLSPSERHALAEALRPKVRGGRVQR